METSQQPPAGGDTSNATPGLVGVSCLLAIVIIVYGVRMYTRIRPVFKLGAPDYLVSAALVSTYSGYLTGLPLMIHGSYVNWVYCSTYLQLYLLVSDVLSTIWYQVLWFRFANIYMRWGFWDFGHLLSRGCL